MDSRSLLSIRSIRIAFTRTRVAVRKKKRNVRYVAYLVQGGVVRVSFSVALPSPGTSWQFGKGVRRPCKEGGLRDG